MARKIYTVGQSIGHLRQAEVLLSQGKPLNAVIREIRVSAEHLLPLAQGLCRLDAGSCQNAYQRTLVLCAKDGIQLPGGICALQSLGVG